MIPVNNVKSKFIDLDTEKVLKLYFSVITPCPNCGEQRSGLDREDGSPPYLYCWNCRKATVLEGS